LSPDPINEDFDVTHETLLATSDSIHLGLLDRSFEYSVSTTVFDSHI